jgi:hypothetical protein
LLNDERYISEHPIALQEPEKLSYGLWKFIGPRYRSGWIVLTDSRVLIVMNQGELPIWMSPISECSVAISRSADPVFLGLGGLGRYAAGEVILVAPDETLRLILNGKRRWLKQFSTIKGEESEDRRTGSDRLPPADPLHGFVSTSLLLNIAMIVVSLVFIAFGVTSLDSSSDLRSAVELAFGVVAFAFWLWTLHTRIGRVGARRLPYHKSLGR